MRVVIGQEGYRKTAVQVADFAEASKVVREFIEENFIGASRWTGGRLIEGTKTIGHVSYNGRVWDTNNKEIEI